MTTKNVTGIIPAIVLIIIFVLFFVFINLSSNKSDTNYSNLKGFMPTENITNTLSIIRQCGITNYELTRDDSLDGLDGENTLGFRIKTNNYNAILYIKDKNIYSIRYTDIDLYRNNNVLKKITDIK